jgi:hypothetical protein
MLCCFTVSQLCESGGWWLMIGVVSAPLWDTASATFAGKSYAVSIGIADKQECLPSKMSFTSFNITITLRAGRTSLLMSSTSDSHLFEVSCPSHVILERCS